MLKIIHEYHTIDKSGWGKGEWVKEPDKIQMVHQETGLDCLIVRNTSVGQLCGYVGVSNQHPLFGKHYDHPHADHIYVHGGLTFTAPCNPDEAVSEGVCHIPLPGHSDEVWWLGFDCAHGEDLIPGVDHLFSPESRRLFQNVYRNVEYVKNEVERLAEQLGQMKRVSKSERKRTKRAHVKKD